MTYLIKINDESKQAKSIVNLLKTLAKDYDFLEIVDESANDIKLSKEQQEELDKRFEYVVKNPKEGKSWDEIERKLLSK
jgi:hypothetical protein